MCFNTSDSYRALDVIWRTFRRDLQNGIYIQWCCLLWLLIWRWCSLLICLRTEIFVLPSEAFPCRLIWLVFLISLLLFLPFLMNVFRLERSSCPRAVRFVIFFLPLKPPLWTNTCEFLYIRSNVPLCTSRRCFRTVRSPGSSEKPSNEICSSAA